MGDGIDEALAQTFDLGRLSPDFLENPYPTYRALHRFAPCKLMGNGQYFLTRYDDLAAIYRDVGLFSSDKTAEFLPKYGRSPLYEHHTTSLVFNDPPLHSRVRRLIAGSSPSYAHWWTVCSTPWKAARRT